jgi:hypothetical protein
MGSFGRDFFAERVGESTAASREGADVSTAGGGVGVGFGRSLAKGVVVGIGVACITIRISEGA